MGLVVQPSASLLPFSLATEDVAGSAGAPSESFAELLAAVVAPGQAAPELAGPPSAASPAALNAALALLDVPAPSTDDKNHLPTADELAGAVAAAIALATSVAPQAPELQQPLPEATASSQAPAVEPVLTSETGAPGASALQAAPASGAAIPGADPAAGQPGVLPLAVPPPPENNEGTDAGRPASPGAAVETIAATATSTAPDSAPLTPALPEPTGVLPEKPPAEPGDGGQQPPGGRDQGQAESVVRIDGNAIDSSAEASATPGPGHTNPHPRSATDSAGPSAKAAPGLERRSPLPGQAARPVPNASEQGIAHAAAHSAAGQLRETPSPEATAVTETSAPTPSTGAPPQVEQVGTAVIEKVEAGGGEATIRLDPAELGEVNIRVRIDDGKVYVEVHAGRPEAAHVFRDHTVDLASLLGGRGLDLADVFVGGGGDQQSHGQGQEARGSREPAETGFAGLLGFEEPALAERHNRLRAAYNPDGAHVYRV